MFWRILGVANGVYNGFLSHVIPETALVSPKGLDSKRTTFLSLSLWFVYSYSNPYGLKKPGFEQERKSAKKLAIEMALRAGSMNVRVCAACTGISQ